MTGKKKNDVKKEIKPRKKAPEIASAAAPDEEKADIGFPIVGIGASAGGLAAFEASWARYFDLYDLAPVGYVILSEQGLILEANLTAACLLGVERNTLAKQPLTRFILPEDQDIYYLHRKQLFETGAPQVCELGMVKKDGTTFWVRIDAIIARGDGDVPLCWATLSDITERERAEEALRESEERYRTLFQGIGDGVLLHDTNGVIIDANEVSCDRLGYNREELLGMNIRDIIDTGSALRVKKRISETLQGGEALFETIFQARSGKKIHCEVNEHVLTIKGVQFIQSVSRDITERKRAEKEFAQHTVQTRVLLDLHMLASAPEGQILDFVLEASLKTTQSVYSLIGLIDETESVMTIHRWSNEAMAQCALDNKPVIYPISEAGLWGDCIRHGKPEMVNDYDAPHPCKKGIPDGHVPIRRFLAVPIFDGSRIIATAVVANKEQDYTDSDVSALTSLVNKTWDILRRKRAEEEKEALQQQLLQSQKMESIGTLASGVAHDFNNMLAIILGNAQLAGMDMPPGDPGRDALEEIEQAAMCAKDLTMKLLTFARKEKLNVRNIPVNGMLEELAALLKRSIPKKIEIKTVLMDNPPPVSMDANQMQQVFLNICNNACDAMPNGGTLTIGNAKVVIDETYAKQHLEAQPGEYCLVRIGDTGIGMIEDVRKRIFDPFFTTKGAGKGTGLGLSISYGIVKNHGGFISVYSEPGKGAEFKIYLPFTTDTTADTGPEKAGEAMRGGAETILVVDDEEAVLKLAGRILEKAGYTVLLADGGKKAVQIYRKRQDEIALVVLDMIMPEMDGRDVYHALKKINPDVRVVLSSGFSVNGQAGTLMAEGIREFIQKPFSIVELCNTVRRVIDGDQPSSRSSRS